nr:TetR/AcrR family transcriptional regulator [Halomonas zhangzhouensis]
MPREERRSQILEATASMMIERGIGAASSREVARSLNVGTGLLFHYFDSWETLRLEAIEHALDRDICEVERRLSNAPPDEARTLLVDWMVPEVKDAYWSLWLDVKDAARRESKIAEVLARQLTRWHRLVSELPSLEDVRRRDTETWKIICLVDGMAAYVLIDEAFPSRELMRSTLLELLR